MAKVAKRKAKPLAGSHTATVRASVAIKELLKTKSALAVLAKRRALLTKIIMEEGAGAAHGYRSYVAHSAARHYWAHKKARDDLKLIAMP